MENTTYYLLFKVDNPWNIPNGNGKLVKAFGFAEYSDDLEKIIANKEYSKDSSWNIVISKSDPLYVKVKWGPDENNKETVARVQYISTKKPSSNIFKLEYEGVLQPKGKEIAR